jgi:hypothetical protein
VAKLASDGSRVLWATYLGSADVEGSAPSVRVDGEGRATVLIDTSTTDMPTTVGAFSRTYRGNGDFWVGQLNPHGGSLAFGSYLGGSGGEDMETHNLVLDAAGNAIVAAGTLSPDFPVTVGAFQTRFGGLGDRGTGRNTNYRGDAIVAKIAADSGSVLGATFVGGRFGEAAEGVALDRYGNVHVTGATFWDDFPVTPDAMQARRRGTFDIFVVKLSVDLRRML